MSITSPHSDPRIVCYCILVPYAVVERYCALQYSHQKQDNVVGRGNHLEPVSRPSILNSQLDGLREDRHIVLGLMPGKGSLRVRCDPAERLSGM